MIEKRVDCSRLSEPRVGARGFSTRRLGACKLNLRVRRPDWLAIAVHDHQHPVRSCHSPQAVQYLMKPRYVRMGLTDIGAVISIRAIGINENDELNVVSAGAQSTQAQRQQSGFTRG